MKTQRIIPKKVELFMLKDRKAAWQKVCNIVGFTIPLDGIISAASNNIHIDVLRLDKRIPNYDSDKCTYKGKPNYSMSMAIEEEWGKEARNLIEVLL